MSEKKTKKKKQKKSDSKKTSNISSVKSKLKGGISNVISTVNRNTTNERDKLQRMAERQWEEDDQLPSVHIKGTLKLHEITEEDRAMLLQHPTMVGKPSIIGGSDEDGSSSGNRYALFIGLYSARNLLPGDPTGLSDPFVKIHAFGKSLESSIIKQRLNPIWNQGLFLKGLSVITPLKYSPPIIIQVFDWDPPSHSISSIKSSSNYHSDSDNHQKIISHISRKNGDLLGQCLIRDISSLPILDIFNNNNQQQPSTNLSMFQPQSLPPKWYDLHIRNNTGNNNNVGNHHPKKIKGKILISLALVKYDSSDTHFRKNVNKVALKLSEKLRVIEIFVISLRGIKCSVTRPLIDFHFHNGQSVKTSPSNHPSSKNPEFCQLISSKPISFPTENVFLPSIRAAVMDAKGYGKVQSLIPIGMCFIQLAECLPSKKDDQRNKMSHENDFNISNDDHSSSSSIVSDGWINPKRWTNPVFLAQQRQHKHHQLWLKNLYRRIQKIPSLKIRNQLNDDPVFKDLSIPIEKKKQYFQQTLEEMTDEERRHKRRLEAQRRKQQRKLNNKDDGWDKSDDNDGMGSSDEESGDVIESLTDLSSQFWRYLRSKLIGRDDDSEASDGSIFSDELSDDSWPELTDANESDTMLSDDSDLDSIDKQINRKKLLLNEEEDEWERLTGIQQIPSLRDTRMFGEELEKIYHFDPFIVKDIISPSNKQSVCQLKCLIRSKIVEENENNNDDDDHKMVVANQSGSHSSRAKELAQRMKQKGKKRIESRMQQKRTEQQKAIQDKLMQDTLKEEVSKSDMIDGETNDIALLDSDNIDHLLSPETVVVRLYVLRGKGLVPSAKTNTCDPYLVVSVDGEGEIMNTRDRYLKNNRNPNFYETFEFPLTVPGSGRVTITVMDWESNMITGALSGILSLVGGAGNLGNNSTAQSLVSSKDEEIGSTTIDVENRWFSSEWHSMRMKQQNLGKSLNGSPVPVERRKIFHASSNAPQGTLDVICDIVESERARRVPALEISPPMEEIWELRMIIWETKDVVSKDVLTGMNDLYVTATLEIGSGDDQIRKLNTEALWSKKGGGLTQKTDIHLRAQKGRGVFNYRMKWKCLLPCSTKPPRLRLRLYDKDLIGSDAICEGVFNLKPMYIAALKKQDTVTLSEHGNTQVWFDNLNHPSFPDTNQGSVLISLQMMPDHIAQDYDAGFGRNPPNANPFLVSPPGRIGFTLNPFKMLGQFIGPELMRKLSVYGCAIALGMLFVMLAPAIAMHFTDKILGAILPF